VEVVGLTEDDADKLKANSVSGRLLSLLSDEDCSDFKLSKSGGDALLAAIASCDWGYHDPVPPPVPVPVPVSVPVPAAPQRIPVTSEDVKKWGFEDVRRWALEVVGLPAADADALVSNQVNGLLLSVFTEEDCEDFRLSQPDVVLAAVRSGMWGFHPLHPAPEAAPAPWPVPVAAPVPSTAAYSLPPLTAPVPAVPPPPVPSLPVEVVLGTAEIVHRLRLAGVEEIDLKRVADAGITRASELSKDRLRSISVSFKGVLAISKAVSSWSQ